MSSFFFHISKYEITQACGGEGLEEKMAWKRMRPGGVGGLPLIIQIYVG